MNFSFVLFTLCGLLFLSGNIQAQSLTWLGTLGGNSSRALGTSDQDTIVVGESFITSTAHAFIWENGVMQDLGTFGGSWSIAEDISTDGSVIVGSADNASNLPRAFRWTVSEGLQDLGTLGGTKSEAYAVSGDGSVVVGRAWNSLNQPHAFRWENGVMQDLGTLGGAFSQANGVSEDGNVVVGWARDSSNYWRAFRWENGVMQDLGTLGGKNSTALGISGDGSVVVGYADTAITSSRYHAFRWENGAMEDLGTLGGIYSEAYSASFDGSVVVGWSEDSLSNWVAFRWSNGVMENLNRTYASLLTNGSSLWYATGISSDGRYIVGWGYNASSGNTQEAFLLDTGTSTEIEKSSDIHLAVQPELWQNYPNPFNPVTTISFTLPHASDIVLQIYDLSGRKVRTLITGQMLSGKHEVRWNSRDDTGQPVASGVYIYQLKVGTQQVQIRKMVLIR